MKNNNKNTKNNAVPNKKSRKALIITTSIILVVALICIVIATVMGLGGNKVNDPVLEYKGTKLPLAFYNLMLSKTKGNLSRAGYDVTSIKFWDSESPVSGMTNAEYYTERTMQTCKLYLLSLYIFEKEGYELPKSYYDSVDQEIADLIDIGYIGGGSEERLNQILAIYGVDIESYREALIIKGKAEYVQTQIFGSNGSKIGDELKEEYYEKYYHRFKQIFVANFYYTYETDEYGYEVYFTPDLSKPLYDMENGVLGFDDEGDYLRDKYNQKIYFEADDQGKPILDKPLYDKENGERNPTEKCYYTDAQMQERYAMAQNIAGSISPENYAAFEAEMEKFNDAADSAEQNPDGYYLSDIASYGYYGYMGNILSALKDMDEGDCDIVKSDEGYHIVMKYELDDSAYSDSDKSVWFDNFTATIMTDVFKERYSDILENIVINEENLAKAESIKIAGINFDYWK